LSSYLPLCLLLIRPESYSKSSDSTINANIAFLKPSPAGEGGVRRNLNNSLLQYSLVNQDIIYFLLSSPLPKTLHQEGA